MSGRRPCRPEPCTWATGATAVVFIAAMTAFSDDIRADECSAIAPCPIVPAADASGPDALRFAEQPLPATVGGARERSSRSLLVAPSGAAGEAVWPAQLGRYDFVVGPANPDHDDSYVYRLPYGDAVSYPVLQGYGSKLSHRGSEYFTVDFGMGEGTLVHAAREGIVMLVEDSHDRACWSEGCGRFANFVAVLHADGTTGEYFHLQKASIAVTVGDFVQRGQVLARSGNTGYTTAPHLHFGVYRTESRGATRSIPVRFATRMGTVSEPRTGARYLNAPTN